MCYFAIIPCSHQQVWIQHILTQVIIAFFKAILWSHVPINNIQFSKCVWQDKSQPMTSETRNKTEINKWECYINWITNQDNMYDSGQHALCYCYLEARNVMHTNTRKTSALIWILRQFYRNRESWTWMSWLHFYLFLCFTILLCNLAVYLKNNIWN